MSPDPFERYTHRVQRVVALAGDRARRPRREEIDTEHLLLAVVDAGDGTAAMALAALGVPLDDLRGRVPAHAGAGQGVPGKSVPLSAAASAVLDRARREADAMGHHYVGTDHLLLSLTAQPGSVAARVLAGIGVTGDHLRPEVARLLDAHPRARRTRDEPTYEQVIGGRRFAVPPAIGAHHRQAERLRDLLHRHGVTVDHPETDQHETAARRSPPAQEHLGT